jgi:hypothetical protein
MNAVPGFVHIEFLRFFGRFPNVRRFGRGRSNGLGSEEFSKQRRRFGLNNGSVPKFFNSRWLLDNGFEVLVL